MTESYTGKKRVRKNFGRIDAVIDMPNLIEVQTGSYNSFINNVDMYGNHCEFGLEEVFKSIFPIRDFAGNGLLEFVKYELSQPKYDVDECIRRDLTYAAPVKVTLRLTVFDVDEATGAKSIHDSKEQDVFMGDIPLMTEKGTFIVNGTERVVVSQMHRSPGVFFDDDKGKTVASGKKLFAARIIPYRGSWLDFEFDAKDLVYARIDRRRKLPVTTIFYALYSKETEEKMAKLKKGEHLDPSEITGMSKEEILAYFYDVDHLEKGKKGWKVAFVPERVKGVKFSFDLIDADTNKKVWDKDKKLTVRSAQKLVDGGLKSFVVSDEYLYGKFLAKALVIAKTGEVIADAGAELNEELLEKINAAKIKELDLLYIDNVNVGPYIRNTLDNDRNTNREEALADIFKVMRPGEPVTLEASENIFKMLFFDEDRYDLSSVGRVKMNSALDIPFADAPDTMKILRKDDILRVVKHMVGLRDGKGEVDDIDHLGNRRVRSVGELMENQYRMGLLRMERAIREKMSSEVLTNVKPQDLVNAKPIAAVIREFFGSSQLSQFMDQDNPLSELTHKRRLSALGPGGLSRDRAGFEVRDVHPTHYGRICPIETPEGPNIGLINALSTYARINRYGFIECPYRKVVDGVVTNDVVYLSADEESRCIMAEANAKVKDDGHFEDDLITCRKAGDVIFARPEEINYIDVSPKQLVSVAAALIPFLENDDANRALMGSNMQRQGVPLIRSEAPLVGTGIEARVAKDSGATVVAKYDGEVVAVDANRIVVRSHDNNNVGDMGVEIYRLSKFRRSNKDTCINQMPIVKVGDQIHAGDIIADGPSTDMGELALGKNVLVAFMPWNGLNYEDAILLSERISRDDVLTSLHIEEFEVMARDTKLGQEEITRDIPNVGEDALRNLDESGIIYIGAEVKAGDILVGKVTPKGESVVTPEEKLLRAIFGEKASDVRDTSLRAQPGIEGVVVDVQVFNRRGVEKDERSLAIEQAEISKLAKDRDDEMNIVRKSYNQRLKEMLLGQTVVDAPKGIAKKLVLTEEVLKNIPEYQLGKIIIKDEELMSKIEEFTNAFNARLERVQQHFEQKVEEVQRGDDLLPGVLKQVKVFIATKRKMQTGDKMAGRHGNKGTVSRVLPLEDMPYMEDGTPVDIVLNPLGVPSRMNVGQILETHLGWAAKELGKQLNELCEQYKRGEKTIDELNDKLKAIYGEKQYKKEIEPLTEPEKLEMVGNLKKGVPMATPVFDGANGDDINQMLEMAGLPTSGQIDLYDGRTGEKFDRKVTVGVIYMIKLHHIVDEKMHARSVGPYSLVTQQPLGGKAQFGGQRFGEMEVWALQAYGAAYTLQEMLTIKSDDVGGRTKVYEAIVRGEDSFEAGIPESFNVLVKEIKSLCLNVEMLNEEHA